MTWRGQSHLSDPLLAPRLDQRNLLHAAQPITVAAVVDRLKEDCLKINRGIEKSS
jgi:hypothetical protein